VFNGKLKTGQVLKAGFEGNSCSHAFGQEGFGMFYGLVEEKVFYARIFSPSRTFESPYLYFPPPPLMPDSQPDPKQEKEEFMEYKKSEKKRLQYEIEQL